MPLLDRRTKIVATVGPASDSPEMLERLIRAGADVIRLNFSHGDFAGHARVIRSVRAVARAVGRRVAILADLPGPKMRLGVLEPSPVTLEAGQTFVLTGREVVGDQRQASTTFAGLPAAVKPGDSLFLNDGLLQLIVEGVRGEDVHCRVVVGGELSSRKGLNLPRIDLGISAFTDHDQACLEFALAEGVDAVSQSFVEDAADIEAVRAAARQCGCNPFVIAKIERAGAIAHFEEILEAADGIMIARGDLGVEIPIEEIAVLQKKLIASANMAGKPVITATQMLESMTTSRLPTRAETTDVANAILDGTDCVMLSGESAVGKFPEEAVTMLGRIAAYTEKHRCGSFLDFQRQKIESLAVPVNPMTRFVESALGAAVFDAVAVPTHSGTTARTVARFRLPVWVVAFTSHPEVAQNLVFSSGVVAIEIPSYPQTWDGRIREALQDLGLTARRVLLITGPSEQNPKANQRVELLELSKGSGPGE